jgi:hypothetical protein
VLRFGACTESEGKSPKAINAIIVQADGGLNAPDPIIRRTTSIELRIKRDQALETDDLEADLD